MRALVEILAMKAVPVDRDESDAYLAREALCTVMALPDLLQYVHRNTIVYSSGVERLVCHLVVIETALEKEEKYSSAFYEKNVRCLGIGKGPRATACQ